MAPNFLNLSKNIQPRDPGSESKQEKYKKATLGT